MVSLSGGLKTRKRWRCVQCRIEFRTAHDCSYDGSHAAVFSLGECLLGESGLADPGGVPSLTKACSPGPSFPTPHPPQVVHILRSMAHTQGRTIVCTIHQPSSEVRTCAWCQQQSCHAPMLQARQGTPAPTMLTDQPYRTVSAERSDHGG